MSGWIKVILMLSMMTFGFFFVYMLVYVGMGFKLTNWSVAGCLLLALASEYGYFLWVRA
jgi:hypothetical protein